MYTRCRDSRQGVGLSQEGRLSGKYSQKSPLFLFVKSMVEALFPLDGIVVKEPRKAKILPPLRVG